MQSKLNPCSETKTGFSAKHFTLGLAKPRIHRSITRTWSWRARPVGFLGLRTLLLGSLSQPLPLARAQTAPFQFECAGDLNLAPHEGRTL